MSTNSSQGFKGNAFKKLAALECRRCPTQEGLDFHPKIHEHDEWRNNVQQRRLISIIVASTRRTGQGFRLEPSILFIATI
jgi:hypothetical protein